MAAGVLFLSFRNTRLIKRLTEETAIIGKLDLDANRSRRNIVPVDVVNSTFLFPRPKRKFLRLAVKRNYFPFFLWGKIIGERKRRDSLAVKQEARSSVCVRFNG